MASEKTKRWLASTEGFLVFSLIITAIVIALREWFGWTTTVVVALFVVATMTLGVQPWVYIYLLVGPVSLVGKSVSALAALKPSSDPSRVQTDYLISMALVGPVATGLIPIWVMARL